MNLGMQNLGIRNKTEWWRGAALYQIYPLSFADSNGDGWGDIPGITERLEYVASLGVDGIWLSPFYRSAWVDFGYDTVDQKAVDARCGTLADFETLVSRAHSLGLKVVIDQVYTYTSTQHPWFAASKANRTGIRADWYDWADAKPDGAPPNNWQSIFGGPAWAWDMGRRQYYMTHFLPEMPHLRLQNPDVQNALLDIGRFWLDRGVDGFRLDVINLGMVDANRRDNPQNGETNVALPAHAQISLFDSSLHENLEFVHRIRLLSDNYSDKFLLGEIAGRHPMATAQDYTRGMEYLHSAYFLLSAHTGTISASALRNELEAWSLSNNGWPTWSFSNHDSVRALTRCGGNAAPNAFSRLLIAILATLRGTVLLYQGDELGLPDSQPTWEQLRDPASRRFYPDHMQRDGARSPMPWDGTKPACGFTSATPWLPLGRDHAPLGVTQQLAEGDSTLAWTRRLLKLRKKYQAIRYGTVEFATITEQVLAFDRIFGDQRIRCVFNIANTETTFSCKAFAAARTLESSGFESLSTGDIRLSGYGFMIADDTQTSADSNSPSSLQSEVK